ncbi:MAG: ABC transporter ATP-binding protein [Eubacteriales bacterium]|nr:ABC transporter ATP-binding protein [Eubacteriales bacterium]
MNALEIRNLTKKYPGFTLDHINLVLPYGCIMGLIGENGAGKTTTIKLILDAVRRDEGTITILGKDNRDNLKLLKEDIGVVMDEMGISECLNAKQTGNIMKATFKNWDCRVYSELLQKLSVPTEKKFKEFSKGMKMKLSIAIALSHHAKLLILDEAASGLDPVVRDEVLDILSEFTREEDHAILFSSHIVSDLEKLCDYIAFLHKGKLMLCEEKDLLMEKYGMIHCSKEKFSELDYSAILGKKVSPYGIEAMVLRDRVPSDMDISPVDIEQLFVFMVKEEK